MTLSMTIASGQGRAMEISAESPVNRSDNAASRLYGKA